MDNAKWSVVYGIGAFTTMFPNRVEISGSNYNLYLDTLGKVPGRGEDWDFQEDAQNNGHFRISGLTKKVILEVVDKVGLPTPDKDKFYKHNKKKE